MQLRNQKLGTGSKTLFSHTAHLPCVLEHSLCASRLSSCRFHLLFCALHRRLGLWCKRVQVTNKIYGRSSDQIEEVTNHAMLGEA